MKVDDRRAKASPRVRAIINLLGEVIQQARMGVQETREAMSIIVDFIDESGLAEKERAEMAAEKAMADIDPSKKPH